jgi:ElaB/YqjD/DUF883 family membrane-anchored ribosome-binding protein
MTYQQTEKASPGDWLVETMRRKPEALLLLGAGCALLMRSGMRSGRRSTGSMTSRMASSNQTHRAQNSSVLSSAPSALVDRVGQGAARVSDYVSDVAENVSGSAKSYASNVAENVADHAEAARRNVSDFSEDARQSISQTSDRVMRRAEATYQSASEAIREQPILVAALGLASGAAVAALFPATEIERRTLGTASDSLAVAAADTGEKLLGALGKAGHRFQESVAEHGLDSDGLKGMARDVAGAFTKAAAGDEQHGGAPGPAPSAAAGVGSSSARPDISEPGGPSAVTSAGSTNPSGRISDSASNVRAKESQTGERSSGNVQRRS